MRLLLLLSVVSLGGCLPFCSAQDRPPRPDSCDNPPEVQLASLQFVHPTQDGGHELLKDNDLVPLITGGQGSAMVAAYLQVTGDVPQCLAQRTELRDLGGRVVESDELPRVTYAGDNGAHTTEAIYLIVGDLAEQEMQLVVRAGGLQTYRAIYISHDWPYGDARIEADAITPDAESVDGHSADAEAVDATVTGAGL